MAIDPEGVDRDGHDANAQGKRKDKLQFIFEQWTQDGASDEAFGVSDGTQGQGQSNASRHDIGRGDAGPLKPWQWWRREVPPNVHGLLQLLQTVHDIVRIY